MTGLPGRTFESWGDFTDLVHRLSPKPGEPFPGAFRGHSDATWLLEPSLLRLLRKAGVTNEQTALELERSALTLFQQDASLC